ncbi:hypothetical protein Naga_103173g1, partial [Nannochloropsis gaditana]
MTECALAWRLNTSVSPSFSPSCPPSLLPSFLPSFPPFLPPALLPFLQGRERLVGCQRLLPYSCLKPQTPPRPPSLPQSLPRHLLRALHHHHQREGIHPEIIGENGGRHPGGPRVRAGQ